MDGSENQCIRGAGAEENGILCENNGKNFIIARNCVSRTMSTRVPSVVWGDSCSVSRVKSSGSALRVCTHKLV